MQGQEGKPTSESSPRRLVRFGGIVAVAVTLSAAAGLLVGWLTAPRARIPSGNQGPVAAPEAGPGAESAPQETRSSPDASRIGASLSRERLAIEWSVTSCLGKPRPKDGWAPQELLSLYEARDEIAEMLAKGVEPEGEKRQWLDLGLKVAGALDDAATRDTYQRQLDAILAGQTGDREPTEDDLLLRAAHLMRDGREPDARLLVNRITAPVRTAPSGKFLGLVRGAADIDRDALLWALRAVQNPAVSVAAVKEGIRELQCEEAAIAAWLALALGPGSEDAERLRLLLGQALWGLGRRKEALDQIGPLAKARWNLQLADEAGRWAVKIERELRASQEDRDALDAFLTREKKTARERRLLRRIELEAKGARRAGESGWEKRP